MPKTAFILAAGYGTRLAPLTNFIPKALFPILGKPALKIIIDKLNGYDINDIWINAHHGSSQIVQYVKEVSPHCSVVIEFGRILGTAGGIANLYHHANMPNETILIHNGDIFENFDLGKAYEFHLRKGSAVTMILLDNMRTNSVIIKKDAVISFEQGKGLTYSGVAFIEPEVINQFPSDRFSSLTDHLLPWMKKKMVIGYFSREYWCDFGTLSTYLELHRQILLDGRVPLEGAGKKVFISEDAEIDSGAKILGFCSIGARAKICAGCELFNCIVWDDVEAKPQRYINAILTKFGNVDV